MEGSFTGSAALSRSSASTQEAWTEAEKVRKMIEEGGEAGEQYLPAYHYLAGYLKLESGEIDAAIEHLEKVEPATIPSTGSFSRARTSGKGKRPPRGRRTNKWSLRRRTGSSAPSRTRKRKGSSLRSELRLQKAGSRPRDLRRSVSCRYVRGSRPSGAGGFSLLEVLLALAITLVVMALVAQTMSHVARIYERESELAVSGSAVALALDDIAYELSLAGQGLGEGPAAVVPRRPGSAVESDALTLRSNPDVRASALRSDLLPGEDVAVDPSAGFEKGDEVLLTENAGGSEPALVERAELASIALRPLHDDEGGFRRSFSPSRGARVLGLREVRYFLGEPRADGRRDLIKDVAGVGPRVLTRDVLSLSFEYLDEENEPISLPKVETTLELASVRVSLRFLPGDHALAPRGLFRRPSRSSRARDGSTSSGAIVGFRLSRVFFPAG